MSIQLAALLVSFVSVSFALEEIVLPNGAKALIGQPLNPVPPPKINPIGTDVNQQNKQFRNALDDESHRWPNGVVPYTFDGITESAIKAVLAAIEDYSQFTCIKWVPRTSEQNFVKFVKKDGCRSSVGRVGGAQELSLGLGCDHKGVAIHEMMHAIGFDHEQNRIDRDDYVKINWQNIIKDKKSNFEKADGISATKTKTLGVPYCYTSVMHYSLSLFSIDPSRLKSMTTIADTSSVEVGQQTGFSDCDTLKINKYYQCSGKDSLAPDVKPTCKPKDQPALDDGATLKSGSFIMKCSASLNGSWSMAPVGCIDPNGKTRNPGDNWVKGRYQMMCTLSDDKKIGINAVGCVSPSGDVQQPGATWTEGGFSHKCQNDSDGSASIGIAGCIDNNGKSRPNGAKWDNGDYVTQCVKNGDSWSAATVGCVAPDGSYKKNGDKWNDGSFIMQCVSKDNGWGVNPVGCITKSSERKNVGDKWVQGRYIFQCTLVGNSISSKLIGCTEQSGTQHSFGETWSEASSSSKEYGWVYKCTTSSSGGASIETTACAYNNAGSGFTSIDQGCYKKFSTNEGLLYVSCKKTATGAQFGKISGQRPNGEEKAC